MESKPIIRIGGDCYETYPCQHNVKIKYPDGTQTRELMHAERIIELLKENHMKIPYHFRYLKKKRDRKLY